MCDCLAWHPEWRVAARRAGVKPGIVFAVFMALQYGGPYPLNARSIAEGLGFKPMPVALILSALQEVEIIDQDLKPVGDWALSRDTSQSHRDSVTVTVIEARRAADRKRQTTCRERKKARDTERLSVLDRPAEPAPYKTGTDSVTVTVTDPLEEERIIPLSPQGARPRDERAVKREALMHGALEEARRLLQPGQYQTLLNQMTERGRYERYLERGTSAFPGPIREFFEKLFAIMKQERQQSARASPPRSHTEPEFPLPITFNRKSA